MNTPHSIAATGFALLVLTIQTVSTSFAMVPQEGIIEAKATITLIHNVEIATRDPGIVRSINVREGDDVERDQTIIRLDRALYESELRAAEADRAIAVKESENDVDLRYAEKSSDLNKKVLNRSQAAFNRYKKSISKTELEQLELELERSILSGDQARHSKVINELTLKLREAQLEASELRLNYREIESPLNGTVAEILVQPGEWAGAGQTVMRVIDLNKLRLIALLDQQYAFDVAVGQTATFELTVNGVTRTAEGTVTFVSPEISVNSDFPVWVEIDNAEGKFKPGFEGALRIQK